MSNSPLLTSLPTFVNGCFFVAVVAEPFRIGKPFHSLSCCASPLSTVGRTTEKKSRTEKFTFHKSDISRIGLLGSLCDFWPPRKKQTAKCQRRLSSNSSHSVDIFLFAFFRITFSAKTQQHTHTRARICLPEKKIILNQGLRGVVKPTPRYPTSKLRTLIP
jgi:hypothetical protein